MKKIVILKHGGGELANQLWNYISIYAYGLERGIKVLNPSFFEYHSFFNFLSKESLLTNIRAFFFKTPRRRSHIINRLARNKYAVQVKIVSMLHSSCIFSSENIKNRATYLPPSNELPKKFENCDSIYFTGWLFRNPKGMLKFRNELLKRFSPNDSVIKKVENILSPLRQKYEKMIGIHIRQSDYKIFKDGKYFIKEERVREIVSEYAKENILDANKTIFVICSDGPINRELFKNLNIYISKENAVIDLFLLSRMDVILGSDSSFGAFASWYGNVPHIIFKNEPIDWEYYSNKNGFFENKYSSLTKY